MGGRKIINEVGNRYGELTVLEYISKYITPKGRHADSIWLCKCSCGNYTETMGTNLRKGFTRSCRTCGNKRQAKAISLPEGEAAFNYVYAEYKRSAKRRKHKWALSKTQFRKLTQGSCTYCGSKPSNIIEKSDLNGPYIYNGIDRIDNSKGYVPNNCTACCRNCNTQKGSITLDIVYKVHELIKERGL